MQLAAQGSELRGQVRNLAALVLDLHLWRDHTPLLLQHCYNVKRDAHIAAVHMQLNEV